LTGLVSAGQRKTSSKNARTSRPSRRRKAARSKPGGPAAGEQRGVLVVVARVAQRGHQVTGAGQRHGEAAVAKRRTTGAMTQHDQAFDLGIGLGAHRHLGRERPHDDRGRRGLCGVEQRDRDRGLCLARGGVGQPHAAAATPCGEDSRVRIRHGVIPG
jgi:hypothetical protein